jgi:hypothetical protein
MRALLVCSSGLLYAGLLLAAAPTHSEGPAPAPSEPERYTMTPTEGGFLRLDRQSGAVSLCTVEKGQALCRAGADERAALEAEISRLRRENAELRSALSGLPAAPPSASPGLPNEEEFERTLSMTERFLRRLLKIFREEMPGDKSPP